MLIKNKQGRIWDEPAKDWKNVYPDSVIDIRDFGAICDDVTDDAAAVQAAINEAGSTSATRSGSHIVIPDHTAIGSTIVLDRKSLVFRGLGWGRYGQSGVQSYLRWIGAAGSPMLQIKNVQGIQVRDLRLIGKSSAKPSCAISLFQVAGFGINQNVLQNICIGALIDDAIAVGVGVVNGIAFEGATANNDTWYFENISINGCSSYVFRQNSNQNVNCVINKLTATDSAEGLYVVGGELTGRGWNFGAIAGTCIYTPLLDDQGLATGPNIHVIGLLAERSGRLLKMDGQGAFTGEGGHFQRTNFIAADGRIVIADSANPNRIVFRNFSLNSGGSGSPATEPYIDVTLAAYGNECFKELILENVALPAGGPQSNGIDARSLGVLDWKHVRFFPGSQGSSASYVVPKAYDVWIGGEFGSAESLSATSTDIPARFRFSPTWYQAITLAANQIILDTSLRLITNRTGAAITLTSTPTIPAGRNGEIITLINVGPTAIKLQDDGTLAGSKLKLGIYGPLLSLGQFQSAQFIYLSTDQTGFENTNAWVLQRTSVAPPNDLPSLTAGSLVFSAGGTTLAQDNANLFWDDTNNRLGIGTNASLTEKLAALEPDSVTNGEHVVTRFANASITCGIVFGWRADGTIITGSSIRAVNGTSIFIGTSSAPTALTILNGGGIGVNTTTPTGKLDINDDRVRVRTAKTPASATAAGNAGDICWDANFIYICVATNTWKRVAIATW